jgi:hypothetical protein
MAEWANVERYIKSNYIVSSQEGTWINLAFDLGNGRSQSMMVTRAGGLIQFISPFATLDAVSIVQVFAAMREESVLLGITSVDGLLLVTHSQLLETTDEEEIDMGIGLVVETADILERRLSGADQY